MTATIGRVNPAVLVLALSSVVRPTSMAALYAMLSSRNPRRLLLAYLLAGLAFTLAVGIGVVAVLQGEVPSIATLQYPAFVDIVLGAAALGFAVGKWTDRLPRARRDPDRSHRRGSWVRSRLDDLSTTGAALAGVVTHLPGLIYLAALNAIVATAATVAGGVVQVVVYDVIWFSTAIGTLTVSVFRPEKARDLVDRVGGWVHNHERAIVVGVFGAVGVYLLGKGIVELSG